MVDTTGTEALGKRSKKQKRKQRVARRIDEALLAEPTSIITPAARLQATRLASNSKLHKDSIRSNATAPAKPADLPVTPAARQSAISHEPAAALRSPEASTSTGFETSKRKRGPGKTNSESLKERDEAWLALGPIRPEENQDVLTERWWSSADLAKLKAERGLKFMTGKFLEHEKEGIAQFLDNFKTVNRLSDDELRTILFAKKSQRAEHGPFWKDLAKAVPFRAIKPVCQYVQRQWHPHARKGPWTPEEDNALLAAHMTMGNSWVKIGEAIERPANDCVDRYKNHLEHRGTTNTGAWTAEETQELERIMQEEYGKELHKSDDWVRQGVAWSAISAKMGYRRTREQIQSKWTEQLARQQLEKARPARWNAYDSGQLVQRLQRHGAKSEKDVIWSDLVDSSWNVWGARQLHKRFKVMRDAVFNHAGMDFSGLLQSLTKRHPPIDKEAFERQRSKAPSKTVHASATATSKDLIVDSDEEVAGEPLPAAAATSSLPNAQSQQGDSVESAASENSPAEPLETNRKAKKERTKAKQVADDTDSAALATNPAQPPGKKTAKKRKAAGSDIRPARVTNLPSSSGDGSGQAITTTNTHEPGTSLARKKRRRQIVQESAALMT